MRRCSSDSQVNSRTSGTFSSPWSSGSSCISAGDRQDCGQRRRFGSAVLPLSVIRQPLCPRMGLSSRRASLPLSLSQPMCRSEVVVSSPTELSPLSTPSASSTTRLLSHTRSMPEPPLFPSLHFPHGRTVEAAQRKTPRSPYSESIHRTSDGMCHRSTNGLITSSTTTAPQVTAPFSSSSSHVNDKNESNARTQWLPFRLMLFFLRLARKIARVPLTVSQVILFWCVPVLVVWWLSLWISFFLGLMIYIRAYHSLVPTRLAEYPVHFKQRPHPFLLIPPYTTPLAHMGTTGALFGDPTIPTGLAHPATMTATESPVGSASQQRCMCPLQPWLHDCMGPQNAPGFAASERPCCGRSDPPRCPSACCEQPVIRQQQPPHPVSASSSSSLDASYNPFLEDGHNEASMIRSDRAVGFVSFDNRTWEAVDRQGLSLTERCLHYHRARHLNLHDEATRILNDHHWSMLYAPQDYSRLQSVAKTIDVSLQFRHIPLLSSGYQRKPSRSHINFHPPGLPVGSYYPAFYPAQGYAWQPPEGFSFVEKMSSREALGVGNGITDNAVTLMITIELFDEKCSLIARSSRPYVVRRVGWIHDTLQTSLNLLPEFLGLRSTATSATVQLIDNFPASTFPSPWFYFARVQLSPSIPILAAQLVLAPRVTGCLATFLQNHALLSFFLFLTTFTVVASCSCTCLCAFFYTLRLLQRRQ